MGKLKINPKDNNANQQNSNAGTSGTNLAFQQAKSNKAKQKTQSQPTKKK